METMYKKLLQLPLFQGLNKKDFTDIIGKVTFHFQTIETEQELLRQGEACNHLLFLLKGKIVMQTVSVCKTFTIEEAICTPCLIEPHSLFGLTPTYQSSYSTAESCDILSIDKKYLLTHLMRYPIFELNYLNILSGKTHSQHRQLWYKVKSNELLERFKRFIIQHTHSLDSPISLYITMEDLAIQLNDTRLNVSRMLNKLNDKKKIDLKRKSIHIPCFHKI